jgi:pyrroloquinoline quinone biosynthesis protein B
MQALVLGSGAGGGVPQWNCACKNCVDPRVSIRTQSSIAVSKNNFKSCVLINSSPDFSSQVRANSMYLKPHRGRETPITDVILTDSHVDHITGLFSMREAKALKIHCTHQVLSDIAPVLDILNNYTTIHMFPIVPNEEFWIQDMLFIGLPIAGKAPPYSVRRQKDTPEVGDTIALFVEDQLFYAPALEKLEPELLNVMNISTAVLVDGTCWKQDDLISQGLGTKTSADMGHIVMSESVHTLRNIYAKHKYFIHINNTNPVLDDTNKLLEEHDSDWKLAYDGLYIDMRHET